MKFEHLASLYDFAVRPDYQLTWFSFDNTTGDRQPIDRFNAKEHEGYFVAAIASAEGNVEVFVRSLSGTAEIVGIERQ